MLNGSKLSVKFTDLFVTIVCDITNEKCMLNFCKKGPGLKLLRIMLNNDDINILNVLIINNGYVMQLLLIKLKIHYFITKQQSLFKDKKNNYY